MEYWVRGSGPAVLLLHGLPTSGRLWDYIVPQLQDRFTCIVVDLPGAGKSSPFPDGSLDPARYARELEALRARMGILRWHLVGHDAGSAIAVHYATQSPERVGRLVLCSPPIFPEHTIPWFFRLLRTPLLGEVLSGPVTSGFLPRGIKWAIRRKDRDVDGIVRAFCQPFQGRDGRRQFLHILRWGDPSEVLGRTAALLPVIAAPTLVLSGRHDGAVPVAFATRTAELIPAAQVELLDCGHFLPLECPEVLGRLLLEFLGAEK